MSSFQFSFLAVLLICGLHGMYAHFSSVMFPGEKRRRRAFMALMTLATDVAIALIVASIVSWVL